MHFRPKTPPPDYEPTCHLLPPLDTSFNPTSGLPFTLEIRPTEPSTSLLDQSTFLSSTFLLDDLGMDTLDVPVTDTRQENVVFEVDALLEDSRTDVGCSKFIVTDKSKESSSGDKKQVLLTSTLTSPKMNCCSTKDVRIRQTTVSDSVTANGLVAQFGIDGMFYNFNKLPLFVKPKEIH